MGKRIIRKLLLLGMLVIAAACLYPALAMAKKQDKEAGSGAWVKSGNKYKYKNNGKYIRNRVKKIKNKYYYFNKKGISRTGWVKIGKNKYYFHRKKRYAFIGKKKVGNSYFIFDKKGRLVAEEGLYKYKSQYYYLSKKGQLEKGWKRIDDSWYFFDMSNFKMYKGRKKINNEIYYFNKLGEACHGIYQTSKYKYFCNSWGKMLVQQMIEYEGKKYYADEKGHLVTGLYTVQSKTYYFNDECEMQTGFVEVAGREMFFDGNGVLYVNRIFVENGRRYLADANGYIVKNRWVNGKFYDYSGQETDSLIDYTDKDKSFVTKGMLDKIDLSQSTKLMVVAHPDDEVLWGGAELAEGDYFVVCLTNGNNAVRKAEFDKVMEKSRNVGMILSYPDTVGGVRSDWKEQRAGIARDLDVILTYKKWGKVVTHNPDGEYGHIHHKLTSALVSQIYFKNFDLEDLYYFEIHYSKKAIQKLSGRLERVSNDLLETKLELFSIYVSQAKCVADHKYLAAYENLINANDWI